MRRQLRLALLAPALIGLAVVAAGCSDDENSTGSVITGTVFDPSGQPVAGAGILLEYTFGNERVARALGDKPANGIEFQLPDPGRVRIWVTGACGQGTVRVLVDGELPAGSHVVWWNGRNEAGQIMPPGMYTMHVQTRTSRSERDMYFDGGIWPPSPPLDAREWLIFTDADGRFTLPLGCLPFGQSIVATDETGEPLYTLTIQNEARFWAVDADLGVISTSSVPVDPDQGAQVELRYLGKGDD